MNVEDCRKKIELIEREWKRLHDELQTTRQALKELADAQQRWQVCAEERMRLKKELEDLRAKVQALEGFKRKVEHPGFWTEDVAYPLAERLRAWAEVLGVEEVAGVPRESGTPVEHWAKRVLALVQAGPGRKERKEIEALLLALWHWLRLQEVQALFEEQECTKP